MLAIPTLQQWQLYETMPLPCVILTTDLIVVAVNTAFLQENQLEREEVMDHYFFDIIKASDETAASLQESFDSALQSLGTDERRWLRYETTGRQLSRSDPSVDYWNVRNVAIAGDEQVPAHIIHFASRANTDTVFLADITRNIEDPIITTDKNLYITRWNRAAERMFEWTAEEAIGKNTIEILRAQFPPTVRTAIIKDINGNGYWHGEVTYLNKSGKEKNALCTVSQLKDGNNISTGHLILIKDITKRIEAERDLAQLNALLETRVEERTRQALSTEQQFKNTLNNMLEGAQIISFNWTYLYVNDTLVRSSRYSREQLLGRTMMEMYPGIEHTNVFKVMQQVMENRHPQQLENEFVFPDGSLAYFQLSIQPVPEGIFVLSIDITQRKNAEVKMAESQANLQNIMERISDSFIALDKEWNYVYVNKAAGIMLNRDPDELIGKNMHEEFPEIVAHHFQQAYTKAMQNQEHILEEGYYEPLGLWLENNIFPSPKGLSLFFRDITQRKNAELELTESEQNLKAIFDNSSEGFILTDISGTVKAYNNNIVSSLLLGVSDQIERGSTIFNIVERERRDFFINVFSHVLAGNTVEYDRQYILEDGRKVWVNLVFNPVKKNADVQGVCISGRDVTNHKNAQEQLKISFEENLALAERLSAILNNIPANIALVNDRGIIVEVNDSWLNFNADGFRGKDFGIGQNYIHVAVGAGGNEEDDSINMARGVSAVLEDKLDEFVYEYSSQDIGKDKWYRMVVTPLKRKEYAGAVIMHMDISEIRRLEAERMRQQMEQQQKITQAILQGQEKERNHIGQELHDNINQILAGTRMYLSIAGNKDKAVKESIRYPMELLDQSMEEIRLLCSNMVTPLQDIQLKQMIVELLEKLKQNSITYKLTYEVPGEMLSDELKLNIYRIIQECSQNIAKYAGARHVSITIISRDKMLHIVVTDDGVGFDTTAKRNGIGISNIRSRVNSFGGNVEIVSEQGKGTSTIIAIPVS